ncbi:PepSY domain-containing protein [Glycocaulis profundi]|nr:PepSY domain-containing protein [Glycocaulis profundi]
MRARGLHRAIARFAAVGAIVWGLSGLIHPVMMWTAPRPAVQAPPVLAADSAGAVAPGALAGLDAARHVRLAPSEAGAYWSVMTEPARPRLALDAVTGAPAPEAARAHAVALARHYADLPDTDVAEARELTGFSLDYPEVNRLLPVWEVVFDTPRGLTVYVDTGSDRLAAVSDDRRRTLLRVFQTVHTLHFLKPVEPLRLALITALTLLVIAVALSGAWTLLKARGRGMRRWHRRAGLVLLPLVLAFPVSGLGRLWAGSSLIDAPPPLAESFGAAALSGVPEGVFAHLAATAGPDGPVWRAASGRQATYHAAEGAPLALDEAGRARQIAGVEAGEVEPVFGFTAEYGFTAKRLPVLRVASDSGPVFADPVDGLIAHALPGDAARAEAWTFSNLHKWSFANPIGARNRDMLMMLAVGGIIALSLSGLWLSRRRRPR